MVFNSIGDYKLELTRMTELCVTLMAGAAPAAEGIELCNAVRDCNLYTDVPKRTDVFRMERVLIGNTAANVMLIGVKYSQVPRVWIYNKIMHNLVHVYNAGKGIVDTRSAYHTKAFIDSARRFCLVCKNRNNTRGFGNTALSDVLLQSIYAADSRADVEPPGTFAPGVLEEFFSSGSRKLAKLLS